ncbi:hypothetical protein VNO78_05623 [Psophocarpus tetragonolobus]|uniref:Uncharacterized protein n=1 Tax=Psophocarpus tetragonolobus TaxID=3891 RepID=A0AAN9SR61_PSOTE
MNALNRRRKDEDENGDPLSLSLVTELGREREVKALEFSECFLCVQANLIHHLVRQNPSLHYYPSLSWDCFERVLYI